MIATTAPGGSPWPLDQIQGLLLRGYRMSFTRHFALSITDVAQARAFIAGLRITSAMPWGERPPGYCLNIGFTYKGLAAFGVRDDDLTLLKNEPNYKSFACGAAAQAQRLYETPNDLPDWDLDDTEFHVLLSVWSNSEALLEQHTEQLRVALAPGFAPVSEENNTLWSSQELEDDMVYFGYRDSIAQPIIQGTPFGRQADGGQDLVDPSAFMIGTGANIYQAKRFSFDQYGCFGAFMVIRQEVEQFEAQVALLAPALGKKFGITKPEVQVDAVKAVLCGRWPNGTALMQFPIDKDNSPGSTPPRQEIDNFRYMVDGQMDTGQICPVGAHIRRANMRVNEGEDGGAFQGVPSSAHRILRRAMPYQIPFRKNDRHAPDTERGLAGLFLGTSMLQQFELVLGSWMNEQFASDMTLADPVVGIPDPGQVQFPGAELPQQIPIKSCVKIRVNAYIFYPGIPAIRTIIGLPD